VGALLYAASRSFDFLTFLHPEPPAKTQPVPRATGHRFDTPRAMREVRRQLAYGPRPAGSAPSRALAETLRRALPRGTFQPVPGNPRMRNIVGTIPGRQPALVIGAHYDTERTIPRFVGANDGAAGTAAVLELARVLQKGPLPAGHREIRFVLFDGEEEQVPTTDRDFYREALRGSKAYVNATRVRPPRTFEMVLLDYIANRGLRLPREGTSDKAMWRRVRAAAASVGVEEVFPDRTGAKVIDDHTPFLRAGLPAVDLIDWGYRDKDTVEDTYDKLSPQAMDAVGETMVAFTRNESSR
jgi:glutaminyl-peptide cyclotransferase